MLQNRIYRGEIAHKGQHYPGEHQPIIDEALWDEVQSELAANAVERTKRARTPSLLAGLLFDGEGHRMTPTHAIKKGTRYRYYVSRPLTNESRASARDAMRIPAGEIEQLVVAHIGQFFSEPARIAELLSEQVGTAAQQRRLLHRAAELGANWSTLTAAQLRPMLTAMIQSIVINLDQVHIHLLPSRIATMLRNDSAPDPTGAASVEPDERPIILSVPAQFRRVGLGLRMLVDRRSLPGQAAKADPKLVKLIARAHHLSSKLAESSCETLAEIAQAEGLTSSYFTRVLRLAYLAPDITRAILEGRHPRDLTAQKLIAHSRLPLYWPEQRRILGFA
jgi:site-specific DNA recombinase